VPHARLTPNHESPTPATSPAPNSTPPSHDRDPWPNPQITLVYIIYLSGLLLATGYFGYWEPNWLVGSEEAFGEYEETLDQSEVLSRNGSEYSHFGGGSRTAEVDSQAGAKPPRPTRPERAVQPVRDLSTVRRFDEGAFGIRSMVGRLTKLLRGKILGRFAQCKRGRGVPNAVALDCEALDVDCGGNSRS